MNMIIEQGNHYSSLEAIACSLEARLQAPHLCRQLLQHLCGSVRVARLVGGFGPVVQAATFVVPRSARANLRGTLPPKKA